MAHIDDLLNDCLAKAEPTPTQKEGARRSQNHLRDLLSTGNMEKRIITSYLSGSYSRDTAIRPLSDVDIIVVIDPSHWRDMLDEWFNLNPSPEAVLASFERAIRYRYPESSIRHQRRSIGIQLDHIRLDVVPAIQRDNENEIYIPDIEKGGWLISAPKTHADLATSLNRKFQGRFIPLVKLLKLWNSNLPETAQFKSFAIETLAVRVFSKADLTSLQQGLIMFWDGVALAAGKSTVYDWGFSFLDNCLEVELGLFTCNIPDAAGTGSNTASGCKDNKRAFVDYSRKGRDCMMGVGETSSESKVTKAVYSALRL